MESRRTLRLRVSPEGEPLHVVDEAAQLLRAGKLVAFPTETVYGLGADATNVQAVADIFSAKVRPHNDPLIVHIAEQAALSQVACEIPPLAYTLMERFWPGPLTLVLPRAAGIPSLVTAGGATVGVRMPSHPVALALLRQTGRPVAAPSANRFMRTSPTTAAHVLTDLDGRIDCVLDGGPCVVGVESTVLDLTTTPPRILRPGGVSLEALRASIPDVVAQPMASVEKSEIAHAPGQMDRHYAPHAPLIVFDATGARGLAAVLAEARDALDRGLRVGALLPDGEAPALEALGARAQRLGSDEDLAQITQRLYAALRALDDGSCDLILTHTYGQEGLGLALWDRLRRAAGGSLRAI